ncbi:hypothetical protein OUZ56_001152 [Daphnia magna]|uniref:Uncharacterized protein n=1 Tax=Daphnia magna TaxID=35525 RepID=A0ABR0A1U0_9CRUS|nr:hypothetical protein OUZ56_001152 [Daphnia magna]
MAKDATLLRCSTKLCGQAKEYEKPQNPDILLPWYYCIKILDYCEPKQFKAKIPCQETLLMTGNNLCTKQKVVVNSTQTAEESPTFLLFIGNPIRIRTNLRMEDELFVNESAARIRLEACQHNKEATRSGNVSPVEVVDRFSNLLVFFLKRKM